jgi:hypothetical protein
MLATPKITEGQAEAPFAIAKELDNAYKDKVVERRVIVVARPPDKIHEPSVT